jgi:HlyD family secretion protein
MKWIRRSIVVLVLAGIAAAVAWSFVPRPILVDVAPVARGELVATVDAEGVTRVKDRHLVSAPLNATLARLELHAGDRVAAGQVLARLSEMEPPLVDAQTRAQARARVAAAQAGLRQAQAATERARAAQAMAARELERVRRLAAEGVVGPQAVDAAETDLRVRARDLESAQFAARVAAHEITLAEAAVARIARPPAPEEVLELRAPVAGRVLRVLHESEGVVAAGAPLVELADPAALEVVVHVPTADAVGITPGAAVTLERWGGPPLRAHVRLVEPGAFTKVSALGIEEQRVNVIIDLDDPPEVWAALGDGYRVEARIAVWRGADVVQVPSSALFRDGASWAVFVWEEARERARLRRVEVGRRSGLVAQVVEGLDDREVVIVHPGDSVADGVRVERR